MAKRRLKPPPVRISASEPAGRLNAFALAAGFLGAAVVYVLYHPSDSVAVERGDALWLALLSLVTLGITWLSPTLQPPTRLDGAVWLLAAWMMAAAWLSSPPGVLRMATNEAWLWVTGAAIFTAVRRVANSISVTRSLIVLIAAASVGLAVHGLHQSFVSLPADRAAYLADPEQVLLESQIDAPPWSAERMVFESRLFDGGPSGTFALANSMAAVVLVGVLLSCGALRFRWRKLTALQRALWAASMLLCAGCLVAARSRSAMLAMFIGVAAVYLSRFGFSRRNGKTVAVGIGSVLMLFLGTVIVLAQFGNREWFDKAPASLSYRMKYWLATWRMVVDRPLTGAGPGNFQAIYEQYREPGMSEQISDPHNFVFETMGSGGFPALVILGLVVYLGVGGYLGRNTEGVGDTGTSSDDSGRWVWLGASVSLVLVWVFGLAVRELPDVSAHVIAVPVSIAIAWVVSRSIPPAAAAETRRHDDREVDTVLLIALGALTLHLFVSGGWTVPGVAILTWIFAGILTRTRSSVPRVSTPALDVRKTARLRVALLGATGLMALLLYVISIRPVQENRRLMAIAASAQQRGVMAQAQSNLSRAVESDSWSPDAALALANFFRWKAIMSADASTARRQWNELIEQTKQRAGQNPAIYRALAIQQMHMFQRYGDPIDLRAANESFRSAGQWSPVDHWLMAQRAVIESALGNPQIANTLAGQAQEMSLLGGNLERHLALQHLYIAEKLGIRVEAAPERRPADQLLSEL